jgi:elongation factor P
LPGKAFALDRRRAPTRLPPGRQSAGRYPQVIEMKINGNEIRPGYVLEHNDRLWMVVRAEHVKPGKGPAYQQVELKDLVDGTKLNERFRAAETVERVRLEEKEFQFLYEADDQLNLMDQETFEQMTIEKDLVGDSLPFLQEGMALRVQTYEGRPLMVHLPDTTVLEVVEADPVVKGQTAAASYKPAVLENGVRIMVPPHIEAGTKVVVNIAGPAYVERAKV